MIKHWAYNFSPAAGVKEGKGKPGVDLEYQDMSE